MPFVSKVEQHEHRDMRQSARALAGFGCARVCVHLLNKLSACAHCLASPHGQAKALRGGPGWAVAEAAANGGMTPKANGHVRASLRIRRMVYERFCPCLLVAVAPLCVAHVAAAPAKRGSASLLATYAQRPDTTAHLQELVSQRMVAVSPKELGQTCFAERKQAAEAANLTLSWRVQRQTRATFGGWGWVRGSMCADARAAFKHASFVAVAPLGAPVSIEVLTACGLGADKFLDCMIAEMEQARPHIS